MADRGQLRDQLPLIAIVWVNHHHLLRFPDVATHRLIWVNFAHLFAVSLMPFSTAWIASTRLGAVPVAFYAGDFVLVNVTYLLLCFEAVDRLAPHKVASGARSMMRMRSLATLAVLPLRESSRFDIRSEAWR